MRKRKISKMLSNLFLSYVDSDRGYFRVLKIIKRLNDQGIDIDINKVQRVAYKCEMERMVK